MPRNKWTRILDLERNTVQKNGAEILIRNATGKLAKSTYGVSYYDKVGKSTGVLY